jgi:hypothetical protein
MSQGETSKDRAMRLLALVRERTEHTQEPVFVAQLADACQLSPSEAQAAWEYLRDHRLINTFSIPYTARINANGIDLLDTTTVVHSEKGAIHEGAATARGYGRVDPAEALDRAREVPKELDRLHAYLPTLTDAEVSAYSTNSMPMGTFLQSKGQTFSVLTEEMLANAFKEEVERRKAETKQAAIQSIGDSQTRSDKEAPMAEKTESTADRWIRALKNNRFIAPIVVAAVIIIGIGAVAEAIKHIREGIAPTTEQHAKTSELAPAGIAKLLSCGELKKVTSESSMASEEVNLGFTNDSDNTAVVSWIDERGTLVPEKGSTIPNTKNWSTRTSNSHIWLISTLSGACLGIVSAGEADSIVKIGQQGVSIRLAPASQHNPAVSNPPVKMCSDEKTLTFSPSDPGVMQTGPDGRRIDMGDGGGGTRLEKWRIHWTAPATVTSVSCSGQRNEHVVAQNKDGSNAECIGSINGGNDALSMHVSWDGPCDQQ